MKAFFISTQLKYCNPKIAAYLNRCCNGIMLSVLLCFSLFLTAPVFAQAPDDGDPADWQSLIANGNYIRINDPRVDKINASNDEALGSGAKDVNDFPLWHWSYQTNDKTDIHHATIVLLPGNVVRFSADRFAQNGDAEIGIWLLKSPLSLNPEPGTDNFIGQHTNGDVLITSKFTNGGTKPTITVRTWQNGVLSTAIVPASGKAGVNANNKNVPAVFQPFQSKFGALNVYPQGAFFEGILDLDDIPGSDECFTRFLFETSQSQSNNEALGDFLLGNFNTKPTPPSVTPAAKCYDGTKATATASCGTGNGTLVFYDAAINGNVVADPSRTAVGVSTFYAACNNNGCESDRVAVTVTINPLPTVDGVVVTPATGITQLADDLYNMRLAATLTASLTATPGAGTAPYEYKWEQLNSGGNTSFTPSPAAFSSSPTATFSIIPPPTGLNPFYDFRVTVRDSKGCIAIDEVRILIDPSAPTCVVNGPDPVCAGSQNNIYTTNALDPDFTYTWSLTSTNGSTMDGGSPQAGQIQQVSIDAGATAGSYTVSLSIVSATGIPAVGSPCSKTVQVKLVTLTGETTPARCTGESNGTMTAVASGGTAPYTYTISPAGTPPNTTGASSGIFTGLAPGVYTITATDANVPACTGSVTRTVGNPPALSCSAYVSTPIACNGGTGIVTVTATGGTGTITGTGTFTVSAGNNQSFTVTDANGCTSTCSVNVPQPPPLSCSSYVSTAIPCYGGSGVVTVTATGGTGPYTGTGTFTVSAGNNQVFNVTDANGCTTSCSVNVPQPPALSCNLTTPSTVPPCTSTGNTVSGIIAGGTGPYTCSASFDATAIANGWAVTSCSVSGNNITVTYTAGSTGPATLSVTVSDANGCTSPCTVSLTCTGGHGCTPGFWKNHLEYWDNANDPVAIAAGFNVNTSFFGFLGVSVGNYCSISSTINMEQAIGLGGGGCNALARAAVAALLNAATLPDYPLPAGITNYAGLKAAIKAAFENGCNCSTLASALDASNNLNHDNCGQVLTNRINSFVGSMEITPVKDEAISVLAYPNPYESVVNFRIASPTSGKAILEVFDILGRKLSTVYQGQVLANTPVNAKFNVPALNRVTLFYKLTVDKTIVRGSVLPEK